MVKIALDHRIEVDGGDFLRVSKTGKEGKLYVGSITVKNATELYEVATALQDVATEILKEEGQTMEVQAPSMPDDTWEGKFHTSIIPAGSPAVS